MRRFLILLGILLILLGLLWPVIDKLRLGRLPGDIIIRREHFTFYFPLTTSILISLVLMGIFWLMRRQ